MSHDRIGQVLDQTAFTIAVRRTATGAARLAAGAVAATALLLAADAAWDLSAGLRLAGLVVVGGATLGAVVLPLLLPLLRPRPAEARAAAERALGDEHRSITAAQELAAMPHPLAQAEAHALARQVPVDLVAEALPPVGLALPAALAGAGLAIIGGLLLLLPGFAAGGLPRLFDPLGDHPPWSRTRLSWVAPPTQVRPGEALRLVVAVRGPVPTKLRLTGAAPALGWGDAARDPWLDVPLLGASDGTWIGVLPPLPVPRTAPADLCLWAEGGTTRTTRLTIAIDPSPVVRRIVTRVDAPAYARLPESTVTGLPPEPMAVHLLAGSQLEARPEANRDVAAVRVRPQGGEVTSTSGPVITVHDPAPGAWELAVTAEDGLTGPWSPWVVVTRRPDLPPTIRITGAASGVATPNARIPLVLEAQDDLGLSQVTHYRLINGTRSEETAVAVGGTSDTVRTEVVLSGVRPGQEVRLGAVARDSAPGGGQLSDPAELRLTIITEKEWNAIVRDQLTTTALLEKYGPLLERLRALEAEVATQAASPDAGQAQDLAQRLAALAAEVKALHRDEPLFANEHDLQRELRDAIAAAEKALAEGRPPAPSAAALQRAIDELTARAEADALSQSLKDLATTQEALAKEAADLGKGTGSDADRARLRQLAQRQRELEEATRAWSEQARITADRLQAADPERAAAFRALADARELRDAQGAMAAAASAAEARNAKRTVMPARTAADALAALQRRCPDGGGSCTNGLCQGKKAGECRSQLARLGLLGLGSGLGSGSGRGRTAGQGGATPPPMAYGPEPLRTRAQARQGGQGPEAGSGTAVAVDDQGQSRPGTAYQQGVRTTTANGGAVLAPAEQGIVDDYFRRLDHPESP